jgi:hypothetical protein
MTVKELITELQKHHPETMVLVSAYEEGYDELKQVVDIKVAAPRTNHPYWEGEYTDYPLDECLSHAILLPRP